jgi:primosomal protein N' (replication factor Y)
MVWVPFGARRLAGIVVGQASSAPPVEIREIEGLALVDPVVIPSQVALATWMAREYLAPLGRALWLMLPPGLGRRSETWVEAVQMTLPEGVSLSPSQRVVWQALKGRPATPLKQVASLSRVAGWREAVAALVEKGLLRRWEADRAPTVRARTERLIRLSPAISAPPPELARAPRQRTVLEFLLAQQGRARADGWHPQRQVEAATGAATSVIDALLARGLIEAQEREVWRDPLAGREFVLSEPPQLTPDQEQAVQAVAKVLAARTHHTFLLHGVTGSGKTEIYLQAVAHVLAQGRRAIILVPEIALTPQTVRRVAARFPGRLTVCHSLLSPGERYDQWRRIMQGQVDVVVGPRSALLVPLRDLGLIVVDEEHDGSYKQGMAGVPYHAREAAVTLGRHTGACIILGSATPDVVSAYRARTGAYTLLRLPQRVLSHRQHVAEQQARAHLAPGSDRRRPLGAPAQDALYADLPPVEVVDLRQELREGNRSVFSRALQQAMAAALAAHQQVILFMNRRGSATFVICRDCGQALTCPRCQVPLSYHGVGHELVCHHCNYRRPVVRVCPRCLSRRIRYFGLGTQKVVEGVRELFPGARIVRWDRDAASRRGSHEELLRQFVEHEADVLVGTQMIAKGLDLPLVTVVGVISADTALHLPDYRSGERTFQLLTQVAGRAGRSPLGGRVIVQTYTPGHYAIQAAARHDYAAFLRRELPFRRQQVYPPFGRLVRLVYTADDAARAREQARELAGALTRKIRSLGLPATGLIGPAPCLHERLRGRWRWQLIVRSENPHALLAGLILPRGWGVDVDPIDFG